MHEGEPQWLVAHTKPQQERWAADNVHRQGFDYYLPMTLAKKNPRKPPSPVCLFPRYLFVRTNGAWRSLLSTFGVTGVIMTGERPSILPEEVVERLKARQGSDGLVYLPTTPAERFKHGERLRINEGPMIGYRGIYEGMSTQKRCQILLDFLGRKTTVLVAEEHLGYE